MTFPQRGGHPYEEPVSRGRGSGFSLVEVVLALGVVSFAIVGIMGLFPVAMKSALESQRETRATHIAQQVFADLSSGPATNTFLAKSSNAWDSLNLATASKQTIYYNEAGVAQGTNSGDSSLYVAEVSFAPNTPTSGLIRVQVDVACPATAAVTNRTTNSFVTLMRE